VVANAHERDADHVAARVMAQAGRTPGAVFGSLTELMDRSAEVTGTAQVSQSRLHVDAAAASAAARAGARAYAHGSDVDGSLSTEMAPLMHAGGPRASRE
jgi:hypothetical protein